MPSSDFQHPAGSDACRQPVPPRATELAAVGSYDELTAIASNPGMVRHAQWSADELAEGVLHETWYAVAQERAREPIANLRGCFYRVMVNITRRMAARLRGTIWVIVGLSAMLGVISPSWSQRLTAFAWYLITPHLLRSGLYQARLQNRDGMRPLIIRVTREPFGERVRLWCPAGISAEDLLSARGALRAACRAADVRVRRDQRRSHIVTVDVIRRRDDVGPTRGSLGDRWSAGEPNQGQGGTWAPAVAAGAVPGSRLVATRWRQPVLQSACARAATAIPPWVERIRAPLCQQP